MDLIFEVIDLLERAREALFKPLSDEAREAMAVELDEMIARLRQ